MRERQILIQFFSTLADVSSIPDISYMYTVSMWNQARKFFIIYLGIENRYFARNYIDWYGNTWNLFISSIRDQIFHF